MATGSAGMSPAASCAARAAASAIIDGRAGARQDGAVAAPSWLAPYRLVPRPQHERRGASAALLRRSGQGPRSPDPTGAIGGGAAARLTSERRVAPSNE